MFGRRKQAKLATKAGRAAYRGAGAVGADRKDRARVAAKAGRTAYRGGEAARKAEVKLSGNRRSGTRYLFYGLPVLVAGAVAAYLSAKKSRAEQSGGHDYQRPEDPNVTGADRQHSDPASGPLIGEHRRPEDDIGAEHHQIVEQRVRSGIGEDPRTRNAPRINVEVNDGVAELRGPVPSRELKEAMVEIAGETMGVAEVRDLLEVEGES